MWFLFLVAGAAALALYMAGFRVADVISNAPGSILGLAEAIKTFEGFYPGTRAYRNNNPGNLKYTSWTREQGAIREDDKGFSVFADYETGWRALLNLLLLRVRQHPEWSILDLFNSYAPPTENDTNAYAQFVAKHVGGDINTKLGELV